MKTRLLTLVCLMVMLQGALGCIGPTPISPADADALVENAKSALDRNDYDGAIEGLGQVVRAAPERAEAHFLLGNAYAKKGQHDQAVEAYQKAIELDADYVDAHSNLGFVYYQQQRLPEAEAAFRKALALEPNDAEIHYNLGGVLAAKNQYDAALTEFLTAQSLDASLPEVYLGLGSVYLRLGRNAEATEALRRYLSLSSDPTWRSEAERMLQQLGAQP
ncbi:MAG: tetratricopeptide repeat protein [Anaerolineae bacterium]|nr:tetratricopeptide repeat protein [Anaerolineae bacterium]